MPTIDGLALSDVLYDTDEIPLYSPTQQDSRKTTLPKLAAYIQTLNEGEPDTTIYSLGATGNSVTVAALPPAPGAGVWVQLTLNAPSSSVTVILPGADDRALDQEVLVTCTQAVSSVTVNGNGGIVLGAPTSLSANGFFRLRYDNISNTWYRIG